eukprot:6903613-Pyramimonas_sp.AAC.1
MVLSASRAAFAAAGAAADLAARAAAREQVGAMCLRGRGSQEEVVEEAICMGKNRPRTSWGTRGAIGVLENAFLEVGVSLQRKIWAPPPRREVPQEVWGVVFANQAGLP